MWTLALLCYPQQLSENINYRHLKEFLKIWITARFALNYYCSKTLNMYRWFRNHLQVIFLCSTSNYESSKLIYFHNVPFLYPLKTSANRRFSDIFRGYRSRTLVENGSIFSKCSNSVLNTIEQSQQTSPWWLDC